MKELRIKDICIKDSSSLKQKELKESGQYPVYGASGIAGYLDFYHQDKPYISIVKDGSGIGRVSFQEAKSSLIGTMQYILPKEGYDIKYIGYCLQSLDLSKYKQGAAIPHIYFRDYGERKIMVSDDIKEQQRIVSRLDAAFAHIDELKTKAENQLAEARALFQKSLAKAMEPKEGWEEKTLKEITTKIGSGATPLGGRKVYINEGVSLVRSMNVHYNIFKYDDLAHINDEAADQLNGVELKQNDVLFNITGASIARCCVLPDDVMPARVNQHVAIIRPIIETITPQFLCLCLISSDYQKELLKIGEAGSTRQALTKADLENFKISVPPLSEQQHIVERLDSISENVRKYEDIQQKIITECDALKQALLRKVFE